MLGDYYTPHKLYSMSFFLLLHCLLIKLMTELISQQNDSKDSNLRHIGYSVKLLSCFWCPDMILFTILGSLVCRSNILPAPFGVKWALYYKKDCQPINQGMECFSRVLTLICKLSEEVQIIILIQFLICCVARSKSFSTAQFSLL